MGFFALTLCLIVVINAASGMYESYVMSMAAKLDQINSVLIGQNISGTFAGLVLIVSIAGTVPYPTRARTSF